MITTTVMSLDKVGIRLLDKSKDDCAKIGAAFEKIFPARVGIACGPTAMIGPPAEYDLFVEQVSPIAKVGDQKVALFKTTKDRRGPSGETFAMIL